MTIVDQELTLAKIIDGEDTSYALHSITSTTDSRYVPDIFKILPELNSEGRLVVEVHLKLDETIIELPFETPAVHIFSLGTYDGDAEIEVEVYVDGDKKSSKTKNPSTANEVRRPFNKK